MSTYLTVKDIAEALQLTERKAKALFKAEGFPRVVIGNKWYVRADKFDAWMEEHEYSQINDCIRLDYTSV